MNNTSSINGKSAAGNWQAWDGTVLPSEYVSTKSFGTIPLLVKLKDGNIKIGTFFRISTCKYIWIVDVDATVEVESWAVINY